MNFSEMADMKYQPRQTVSPQRETASAYQKGLQALRQARTFAYRDKNLLRSAFVYFKRAIQESPYDVKPYLGLSYLLIVAQDFLNAARILKQVQAHFPGEPDVQALLDYLGQQSGVNRSAPATCIDYDGLYDEVKALLRQKTKQLLASQPDLSDLSMREEDYQALKQRYQVIQGIYNSFLSQLEIIEEEIDSFEIQRELKPLEMLLNRYRNLTSASVQFMKLQQKILQQNKETHQLIDLIKNNANPVERKNLEGSLDALFDSCDAVADQLDALEQQGYHISLLLGLYESSIADVQALQDLLDEY